MKLKNNLYLYLQKKKARRFGVKINDFSRIAKNSLFSIEETASLGNAYVRINNYGKYDFVIGAHSYIRSGNIEWVEQIGRFCSIGQNVVIGQDQRNHPVDLVSTSMALCVDYFSSPSTTRIGNDVWIGDHAVIMSGVKIGDGAIIGRSAVVTKDVKPYQIVAGNPAQEIRYRFASSIRGELIASAWWNKDVGELRKLDHSDVSLFLKGVTGIVKQGVYPKLIIEKRTVSCG
jgi:acetyltransferase-like isoleucine patch superfamily enzyme